MDREELCNLRDNLHKYKTEIFRSEFEKVWSEHMLELIEMALEREAAGVITPVEEPGEGLGTLEY